MKSFVVDENSQFFFLAALEDRRTKRFLSKGAVTPVNFLGLTFKAEHSEISCKIHDTLYKLSRSLAKSRRIFRELSLQTAEKVEKSSTFGDQHLFRNLSLDVL